MILPSLHLITVAIYRYYLNTTTEGYCQNHAVKLTRLDRVKFRDHLLGKPNHCVFIVLHLCSILQMSITRPNATTSCCPSMKKPH